MKKSRPSRAAFRRVLLGIEQLEDRRVLACVLNLSSTFVPGGSHVGGTITTKLNSIDQAILLNGACVVNAASLGASPSIMFRGDLNPDPIHQLRADVVEGGNALMPGGVVQADGGFVIEIPANLLPSQASEHEISISITRTDAVRTPITGMTPYSLRVDTVRPTVSSILRQNPISASTNQSQVVFRVTFSEPVEQVSTADFALSGTAGGNIASLTPVSTSVYDVTVNGLGRSNGTLNLGFAPGQNIRDLLTNAMTNIVVGPGQDQPYLLDTIPPVIGRPSLDVTDDSGAADGITNHNDALNFSGVVTGATSVSITIQNNTFSDTVSAAITGSTYTTQFNFNSKSGGVIPEGTYRVVATASDGVNSPVASSEYALIIDHTGPTVLDVIEVTPDPRNTPVTTVEVIFNEAINLGTLTFADVTLTRDGNAVALDSSVVIAPLPTIGRYQISGLGTFASSDGQYVLTVTGAAIQDVASNSGAGSAADSWLMNSSPPSAGGPPLLAADDGSQVVNQALSRKSNGLTFSGTATDATSVTVRISNGPFSSTVVAGLVGDSYTAEFNGVPEGTYQVVATASDGLNPPTLSEPTTLIIDQTAPQIVSLSAVVPNLRNTPVSDISLAMSEEVQLTEFTKDDFSLTRGGVAVTLGPAVGVLQGAGSNYLFSGLAAFTTLDGDYVLTLRGAGLFDLAGNAGNNQQLVSWTMDTVAPNITGLPKLDSENDSGELNSDGVTNQNDNLKYSILVTGATSVSFRISNALVNQSVVATTAPGGNSVAVFDFSTLPGGVLPEGVYDVTAVATDGVNVSTSLVTRLVVDRTAPPKLILSSDAITNKTNPNFVVNGGEINAQLTLLRDAVAVGLVSPEMGIPPIGQAVGMVTDLSLPASAAATYRYQAVQSDRAGNVSGVSDPFFVVIDSVAPVIKSIALENLDTELNSNALAVPVTKNTTPTFNLELSDQKYARSVNTVVVEVFRSESPSVKIGGTTINLASLGLVNGGAHTTFAFTANVQFNAGIALEAGKQHSLLFKVTDSAKQVSTRTFSLFVAKESGASMSAPATPVDTTFYFMGARLVNSIANNGKAGSTSITVNQNVRNGANIRLFNESDSTLENRTVTAVSGTGPFVLTLDSPLDNTFSVVTTKISWLRPWTMAFDKTTQTTWFSNEDGHYIGQFDPATGSVKLYDIVLPDTGTGAPSYDPHGVFFDFNTHLTPRVWFAYRNAVDGNGDTQPTTNINWGRLGYIDVLTQQLFTFDLSNIVVEGNPIKGTHAIVIDTRGHAWVSSERSNAIIELDLKTLVDGSQSSSLNSQSGSAITHTLPKKLGDIGDQAFEFEVHGLQVVVDQRTNQPYVWLTDGNNASTGRIVLLRPGSHATSPFNQSRSMDEWFEFNIDEALTSESRLVKKADGTFTSTAHPLFFALDDNETPGVPEDDRIISPDGGALSRSGTAGVIRSFDSSALLSELTRLAPKSYADISLLPASIPVATTIIPKIPGSTTDNTNSAPSQASVDRGGTIYFNDQVGSIGRLNFDDSSLARTTINAPIRYFKSNIQVDPVAFTATTPATHSFIAERLNASSATARDRSQVPGVDQYELAQKSHRGRGEGAFRFVLSAENTAHTAITQSDHLAVTVFAESTRRALAVVESPFELPRNARIGGRVALQVLRDGSVVLTARGDGELLDEQVNLTRELLSVGRIASFDDAAVLGDMAALGNPDGSIEALGRQGDGRLIRFSFTPPSRSWTTADLKNAKFWTASTRLSVPVGQLVAEDPDAAPGIGFTITTSAGHLIVIPSGGEPKDLSVAVGSPAVYSGVGGIQVGDKLRFYGTNQTGSVIEYQTDLNLDNVSTRTLILPSSVDPTSTRMLRNITPLLDGTTIHLFGTDGVAQLVHYELSPSGAVTLAENVTQVVQKSGKVFGYFDFERPYGGRVYTYVSAISQKDGTLRVYGTNGGELIEFTRDASRAWRVGNLTNDIKSTDGVKNDSRIPANFVFGAPSVYEDQSGERHILQINADGEVIEYYMLANETQKRFHTQNINLRIGNDSLITNLRFRAAPLTTTASISTISTTRSSKSFSAAASVFAAPYISSLDVNADGTLSPLDVLIVINYLNSSVESNGVADGESSDNRLDVNRDSWISPLDVLTLVNHLNGADSGMGAGEGESASSDQQSISASALDFAFAELDHWDSFETFTRKNRRLQRN